MPPRSDAAAKGPQPRAVPPGGAVPTPTKDRKGRVIPTNKVVYEKWGKPIKEPSEPPAHSEINWQQHGAAASEADESAITPEIAEYLAAHNIPEIIEQALSKVVHAENRPEDPIGAIGILISQEAVRRKAAESKAKADAAAAALASIDLNDDEDDAQPDVSDGVGLGGAPPVAEESSS